MSQSFTEHVASDVNHVSRWTSMTWHEAPLAHDAEEGRGLRPGRLGREDLEVQFHLSPCSLLRLCRETGPIPVSN